MQVSEKTIERLATKGDIRRATRKRPGIRPLPVYDPDDLQKIKETHIPRVEIITQADAPQQQPALVPRLDLPSFLQSFGTGADVPLRDKLFFSVKEAARFAGLPQATIRRLIHVKSPPSKRADGALSDPTWNNSIADTLQTCPTTCLNRSEHRRSALQNDLDEPWFG